MSETPKIAIMLETSRAYGRGLLDGIVRYKQLHGPWTLIAEAGHFERERSMLKREGFSGAIMRINSPEMARKVCAAGVPVVTMESAQEAHAGLNRTLGLPEIRTDSAAVGRMAAEHFLERGFRRFAYCGIHAYAWSDARQRAFAERVAEAGFSCYVYPAEASKRLKRWEREMSVVTRWLRELPKPVGLMVSHDDRGLQVLQAAAAGDTRVPEEVAIVGVDDDELLCELCDPPLSSVATDLRAAGYAAAELLDEMMAGRSSGYRLIDVKPLWVTTRRSSDVVAQEDRLVAQMLRFIRDNAGRPIAVPDVIESIDLSRRTLERRFADAVGHSILDEITYRRLERCKRLLIETKLSMDRVAMSGGFSATKPMTRAFRHHEGCSPWQYRKTRSQS